jgi:purine-binding chemotaxis protein CheW
MPDSSLCTFYLDGSYFGIAVEAIQEIMYSQETTRVAKAPAVIAGLINLRGQIIAALDMRARLGLSSRDLAAKPMNVIVRMPDCVLSLIVDRIGDVVAVGETQFEAVPDTVSEPTRSMLRGAYRLEDSLLLVLDLDRVVNLEGNGVG